NATGVYQDTLKYQSGCDSLITTVDLSLNSITRIDQKMIICAGEKYTLPTGKIVSTSGIYNDTLKYSGGCDSLVTVLDLTIKKLKDTVLNYSICEGQTFTLPWGTTVKQEG